MKDKNTMSLKYYLFSNLYWGLLSMYWFRAALFKTVDTLSLNTSKTLLWLLFVGFISLGIAITYKVRRNNLSLLVNIALPFEIYAIASYSNHIFGLITASLIAATILSVGYILIISTAQITDLRHKQAIIKRRIIKCLLGTRTIVSCCMLLVISFIVTAAIFGTSLTKSSVAAHKDNNDNIWTIANNIEQVCLFSDESWHSLSDNEKTSAMQVIANIECRYLGLPHELNVITSVLPDNVAAAYNDRTHTININIQYFDDASPSDILDSICHEAYHAYQYRLCEAYDDVDDRYKTLLGFYDVPYYKQEFKNYTNGGDDLHEYYFQHCESRAREYAHAAVSEYEYRIYEHMKININNHDYNNGYVE